MNNPLISIVIPIYNADAFLDKCLQSVLQQTYKNLEVILVDDGSLDASGSICDEYALKDARVIVLHQTNQGVAKARKKGVEIASGEWVTFADADDLMQPELVEYLLNKAGTADMVTAGVRREERDGRITERKDGIEEGLYEKPEQLKYVWNNMLMKGETFTDGILPYVFSKLYRRTLAEQVMVEMDSYLSIDEDRAFVLCYTRVCQAMVITHELLYNYRYEPQSAMHRQQNNYLMELNLFYNEVGGFLEKHDCSENELCQLRKFVYNRLHNATTFMRFPWELKVLSYYNPYRESLDGKKIVLYGAGEVGTNYYRELRKQIPEENIYWTDKSWKEKISEIKQLKPVEEIYRFRYDVVIIAVLHEMVASQICSELMKKGVPEEKIYWDKPIVLKEI